MVPPAPGLFSMMTGWPSLADSSLETARPITAIKRRMVSYRRSSFGGNLPADAGHIQAPQDALARSGEFGTDGGKVGAQQPAITLGKPAGDQHVADPCAAPLHDDGRHRIVHRPHGQRPERHHR